jgi:hypothetical protein
LLNQKQRKLVPLSVGCDRLGVGDTKLREEYIKTGRLRVIYVGAKSPRLVEDELDAVVAEVIANPPAEAANTAHMTTAHMRNAAERRRAAERKGASKRSKQTKAA